MAEAFSSTAEAWRSLQSGDPVKVVRGIFPLERSLLGKVYVIDRFAQPHGYAVVKNEDGRTWHVHPEALEKVSSSKK